MAIPYSEPEHWIKYDAGAIARPLSEAAAGILSLRSIPYRREWADRLQEMELKREIAGTSQIEGADFVGQELEEAYRAKSADELATRSQKQAFAVKRAYQWVSRLPMSAPVTRELIVEVHRLVIQGADEDHCAPGRLRESDQNVTFGLPRHRGVSGGDDCERTFSRFMDAIRTEYPVHDLLVQALAAHYHLAAMHPFLDGNGRTARLLEALLLQKAGLHSTCFVAMSNYYYDQKDSYLKALASVRASSHDLTPFLVFGLNGIASETRRLLNQINSELKKVLFRDLMNDLINRLRSKRRRVIAERQARILETLLERGPLTSTELVKISEAYYESLGNPIKALARDIGELYALRAIEISQNAQGESVFNVRMDWPSEMSDTELFKVFRDLPKARTPQVFRI